MLRYSMYNPKRMLIEIMVLSWSISLAYCQLISRLAVPLPTNLFKPGHVSLLDFPRNAFYVLSAQKNLGTLSLILDSYSWTMNGTIIKSQATSSHTIYTVPSVLQSAQLYMTFSSDRSILKVLARTNGKVIYVPIQISKNGQAFNLVPMTSCSMDINSGKYPYMQPPLWWNDNVVMTQFTSPADIQTSITAKFQVGSNSQGDCQIALKWPNESAFYPKSEPPSGGGGAPPPITGTQQPKYGVPGGPRLYPLDNSTLLIKEEIQYNGQTTYTLSRINIDSGQPLVDVLAQEFPMCHLEEQMIGFHAQPSKSENQFLSILVCALVQDGQITGTTVRVFETALDQPREIQQPVSVQDVLIDASNSKEDGSDIVLYTRGLIPVGSGYQYQFRAYDVLLKELGSRNLGVMSRMNISNMQWIDSSSFYVTLYSPTSFSVSLSEDSTQLPQSGFWVVVFERKSDETKTTKSQIAQTSGVGTGGGSKMLSDAADTIPIYASIGSVGAVLVALGLLWRYQRTKTKAKLSIFESLTPVKTDTDSAATTMATTMVARTQALYMPGFLAIQPSQFKLKQVIFETINTKVYMAEILDQQIVAREQASDCIVKVPIKKMPEPSFIQEVSLMHYFSKNPLFSKLYGFSSAKQMVMVKYYPLGTLSKWIRQTSGQFPDFPYGTKNVVKLVHDLASGLNAMHTAGFVHSDIKPDNLLLDIDGVELRCVITDFGSTVIINEKTLLVHAFKLSTKRQATPAYAPPEVVECFINQKAQPQDLSSDRVISIDVYSFGMVIYEMLARRCPFHDVPNLEALVQSIVQGQQPHFTNDELQTIFNDPQLKVLHEIMIQCRNRDPLKRMNMPFYLKLIKL